MSDYKTIRVQSFEGWSELCLNRPEKRNAISFAMVDEIAEALANCLHKVVVLTAVGPIFCAGADLEDRGSPGKRPSMALIRLFLTTETFVIAEVEKPAVGAGAGLMMACALAVCSDETWFALPEGRLGFFPEAMACLLEGNLPPRLLMEVALGTTRITAAQALAAGMVSESAPVAQLRERVLSRVRQGLEAPELFRGARRYWQTRLTRSFDAFQE